MAELSRLYEAILDGDDRLALELTKAALAEAVDPVQLINRWMIPAMDEAGRRFEAQEFFFPEMLMAAHAMKSACEPLRPLLAACGARPTGLVVLGTVKGDLHDIGKNMVSSMLEGAGFQVLDIGIDVPPEKFVEAVKETRPHILGLSALLTTTMPEMNRVIGSLQQAGLRGSVKVMVGGAPVSQAYADEIGADGYGSSASAAVTVARALIGK
jgi:5-methyltetrahydrofolate--homocysteine methyltransferase